MTQEATRRHYLDAMGITAWACRFVLPGAAPTQECEWEAPTAAAEPRQALHALLEEPSAAPARAPAPAPASPSDIAERDQAAPKSARALLGDIAPPEREEPVPALATSQSDPAPSTEPVVFTFTCVCIDGRWLSVHPGTLSPIEQRLLTNVLTAAGILEGALDRLTTFNWPPVADTFTPEDPLGEAREGVAAFIEGAARRQGWQLERLLWWADTPDEGDRQSEGEQSDDTLRQVLELREDQSHTLALPVWQAPGLSSLTGAPAKRALWPALLRLAQNVHAPRA